MSTLPNLGVRCKQPELMDDPALPAEEHLAALRGLAFINRLSRSDAILWPALRRLAIEASRPLRVLDIACGGGDVLAALRRRSVRAGLPIEFAGADVSPIALEQARKVCTGIPVFALDVLRDPLPGDYDVLMSSLFLHHLETEAAGDLLRRMGEATRRLVLINDLIRSPIGYSLAWLGARILSRSHVVHVDGPRSVAGAFTMAEALGLAEAAGLHGAAIGWRWPFRFLLSWECSHGL